MSIQELTLKVSHHCALYESTRILPVIFQVPVSICEPDAQNLKP